MQTTTTTAAVLTITATNREGRDAQLEAAVATMRAQAVLDGKRGILVKRHAPGSYTVELSDEVPFGLTHERDLQP